MPLLQIVLILLAVGVLMAVINLYGTPYVDARILRIINFVIILVVVLWLLKIFGVWAYLSKISV
jgi:hypothetical protein